MNILGFRQAAGFKARGRAREEDMGDPEADCKTCLERF
jgi:hypothetical protein